MKVEMVDTRVLSLENQLKSSGLLNILSQGVSLVIYVHNNTYDRNVIFFVFTTIIQLGSLTVLSFGGLPQFFHQVWIILMTQLRVCAG